MNQISFSFFCGLRHFLLSSSQFYCCWQFLIHGFCYYLTGFIIFCITQFANGKSISHAA
uniref:Uncharacterized protein n=1 Tax=Rhizophora mucronata TaxID=61149 RepID=A0A2P2ITZ8_RHIMU